MPCTCLPQVDDPFCEVDGDLAPQVPRGARLLGRLRRIRNTRGLLMWAWLAAAVAWALVMVL